MLEYRIDVDINVEDFIEEVKERYSNLYEVMYEKDNNYVFPVISIYDNLNILEEDKKIIVKDFYLDVYSKKELTLEYDVYVNEKSISLIFNSIMVKSPSFLNILMLDVEDNEDVEEELNLWTDILSSAI